MSDAANTNAMVDELLGQLDAFANNRHHSFVTTQQMARESATILRVLQEKLRRQIDPTPVPTEAVEAAARSDAAFDGRTFNVLGRADKQRYTDRARAALAAALPHIGVGEASADDIRAKGWSVAVHNDYRLNGDAHTFWLFTKGDRAVKGEGRTDAEALNQVRVMLAAAPSSQGERG